MIESGNSNIPAKNYKAVYVIIPLLFFYLFVIVKNAWIGDDAYITFRTVDNFVNGYGLTWNVAERVQSFTNPLWVLLVSAFYAVTGEAYYTSIFLSLILDKETLYIGSGDKGIIYLYKNKKNLVMKRMQIETLIKIIPVSY